jgi:hypothetical protein
MFRKTLFAMAVVMLLANGCNNPEISSENPPQDTANSNNPEVDNDYSNPEFRLEGTSIIYNQTNEKLGELVDGKIYITVNNTKLAFPGSVDKLSVLPTETPLFFYNDVSISDKLTYPMGGGGYVFNQPKMSCAARMFPGPKMEPALGGLEPQNFYYCKTDSVSMVSEFVFTNARGSGFSTGGDSPTDLSWKKIHALKKGSGTIFLIANLTNEDMSDEEFALRQNSIKSYWDKVATKSYLDKLLQSPNNQKLIQDADQLAASIEIIK